MRPRLSASADTTCEYYLELLVEGLGKTLMKWHLQKHLCQMKLFILAYLFEGGIEHGILLQTFC